MIRHRFRVLLPVLLTAGCLLAGCGKKHAEGDSHAHGAELAEGKDDGHSAEAPTGTSFKPGKGITLTDETRKILNLTTTDVTEEKLPRQIRFSVQVFDETHRHKIKAGEHLGCDVHGSGFLTTDRAALVRQGQPVQVQNAANENFSGAVLAVQPAPALGEIEVIVGVTNGVARIRSGDFLAATISEPRNEAVSTIPATALLRTSEGTFVYVVNGDAYYRTAVKVGDEADGKIEITDGLFPGDAVVTKPVETLWLIELRATKGGGHSH